MSLLSSLRKAREERLATATPAIAATQPQRKVAATVARISTVPLAHSNDEKSADGVTSWGWLLHFDDRESLEIYCHPDATRTSVLKRHPGAVSVEPIPVRVRKMPTDVEPAELRLLVQAVGRAERWLSEEIEVAIDAALGDAEAALVCYRALAVEYGVMSPQNNDRRSCNQCANLRGRVCSVAYPGGWYPLSVATSRCQMCFTDVRRLRPKKGVAHELAQHAMTHVPVHRKE